VKRSKYEVILGGVVAQSAVLVLQWKE